MGLRVGLNRFYWDIVEKYWTTILCECNSHIVPQKFLWCSYRFPDMFPEADLVRDLQRELDGLIDTGVSQIVRLLKNADPRTSSTAADNEDTFIMDQRKKNARKGQYQKYVVTSAVWLSTALLYCSYLTWLHPNAQNTIPYQGTFSWFSDHPQLFTILLTPSPYLYILSSWEIRCPVFCTQWNLILFPFSFCAHRPPSSPGCDP